MILEKPHQPERKMRFFMLAYQDSNLDRQNQNL